MPARILKFQTKEEREKLRLTQQAPTESIETTAPSANLPVEIPEAWKGLIQPVDPLIIQAIKEALRQQKKEREGDE